MYICCLVIYLGPPKSPANLNVVKAPTVLEAKWTAVEDCDAVHYVITATVLTEGNIATVTNVNTNATNHTITGLCPNTTYNVSVTAYNIAGNSSSTTMEITTNGTGKLYYIIMQLILLYACITIVGIQKMFICMYIHSYIL